LIDTRYKIIGLENIEANAMQENTLLFTPIGNLYFQLSAKQVNGQTRQCGDKVKMNEI
jgi:hypothetical protein